MKSTTMFLFGVALLGSLVLSNSAPVAAAASKVSKPLTTENVEGRIKKLHADLRITAAQEAQWTPVAEMMRDNAKTMTDLREQQDADRKMVGAVDELKSYAAVIDAHADSVRKFIPVFQSLYDSMSDAQKKTADTVFRDRVMAAAKRNS